MTRPGSPFSYIPEPCRRGTRLCRPALERISELYRSIGSKRFDPCRTSVCLSLPWDICTCVSPPDFLNIQSIPFHSRPLPQPLPKTLYHAITSLLCSHIHIHLFYSLLWLQLVQHLVAHQHLTTSPPRQQPKASSNNTVSPRCASPWEPIRHLNLSVLLSRQD